MFLNSPGCLLRYILICCRNNGIKFFLKYNPANVPSRLDLLYSVYLMILFTDYVPH